MHAKGIVQDMSLRRKITTQLLIFTLIMVAVGNWVIDDWLRDGIIRFAIYWGGITFLVLFVLLMAMYDLLKVMSQSSDDY